MSSNETFPLFGTGGNGHGGLAPCRPLMKWPGGKSEELPVIRSCIPPHTRYFEPFLGGGAVFFDAIQAPSFINDKHEDLMNFYACVQGQTRNFFRSLDAWIDKWDEASLEARNAMYYEVRGRYNANGRTATAQAVDFFLLRELAYGGMFRVNSRGAFNVPFGRAYALNKNLRDKVDHLRSESVVAKMGRATLSAKDFGEFMEGFEFTRDDFMFVDPPYDSRFSKYDQHDFDSADHERLAKMLRRFPGRFMLICKLTPFVEQAYLDHSRWRVHRYRRNYRFNIKGRFSRSVTHVMIVNYDAHP